MKSNILKYMVSATLAVGMVSAVQAIPITGSIGFTGAFVQNGGTAGNLASATSFTILNTVPNPITIHDATGAFVGAGAPIVFATSVGVNATPEISLVGAQLWSVLNGLTTYSLTVTTEGQTFTSGIQLNLAGNGILHDGNAADDTAGVWQIGFGVSGNSFTWQSTSSTSSVPDGGATVMLLGAAFSGLALLRRKLA
jgi:hypothetical protein